MTQLVSYDQLSCSLKFFSKTFVGVEPTWTTGQFRVKWDKLVASLQNSWPLRVERCYFKKPWNEMVYCNLYGFCDASLKAYGAVVYLQVHKPLARM